MLILGNEFLVSRWRELAGPGGKKENLAPVAFYFMAGPIRLDPAGPGGTPDQETKKSKPRNNQ